MKKTRENGFCALRWLPAHKVRLFRNINDSIQEFSSGNCDAALLLRDPNEYRIIEETLRSCRSARVARRDNDVGTENAEFRRQAALGVDLQIEESRGDGGARAERK